MDYSELINQLIDGELDTAAEASLYARLAADADLRTSLREQLAMRFAIQEDRALLVPPAALTNKVFTGLGFTAPLAGSIAGTAGGSMLAQWLTRLGLPVASALMAAGLAFWIQQPATPTHEPMADSYRNIQTAQTGALALESPISVAPTAPVTQTIVRTVTAPDNTLLRTIAQLKDENNRLREALRAIQHHNEADREEQPSMDSRVIPVTSAYTVTMQRSPEPLPFEQRSLLPHTSPFQAGPVVQLRGFPLSASTGTAVQGTSDWYTNIGLAFLYRFNQTHSAGIEMGNETFPMVFDGNRNGQLIRYDQNPATMWWGATYRYSGPQWSESGFAPYGQVTLAGSQLGPVGRTSAGVTYSPAGNLTFVLGAEAATLAYSVQNQWYLSPKFGLTYGLAIRF